MSDSLLEKMTYSADVIGSPAPDSKLLAKLFDSGIAKTELEHYAAREIKRLSAKVTELEGSLATVKAVAYDLIDFELTPEFQERISQSAEVE